MTPLRLALLLTLLLLVSACSGLAGEPAIVATIPPPTDAPPETGYPPQLADLTAGAAIFAERCAECHGPNGAGDGELALTGQLVVNGVEQNPGNFTDPATARDQTPLEWYATITNGRLANLMPPWREALTEQQRWDVALYTYTLHYAAAQLERGQALWQGVTEIPARFSDQETMANTSDAALYALVAETLPDANTLTEDNLWAAVAYARSLSVRNIPAAQPDAPIATEEARAEATEAVEVAAISGAVTGTISSGTATGTVPDALDVTLFIIDADLNSERIETTSQPDGTFRFDDVPLVADNNYAVAVSYRERTFISDIVNGDPDGLVLPVTIYEFTEDPAVITITGVVTQLTPVSDGLQVVQVFNFRNDSDRMFTSSDEVAENQFASIVLDIPPGAVVLGFPGTQGRFVTSEDQSTVTDTQPVLPGSDHIVQMVYLLPYQGSAIIDQAVNYRLDGVARLLIDSEAIRVNSGQYAPIGVQTIGDVTYQGYGATLALQPGDVLRYELSGGAISDSGTPGMVSSNNLLVVGLVFAAGLVLLIGGLYIAYRRGQHPPAPAAAPDKNRLIDTLLGEIADLDAQHERGDINHDLYQRRRQQLKARLAELMDEADA